jgi:hypothetical protein
MTTSATMSGYLTTNSGVTATVALYGGTTIATPSMKFISRQLALAVTDGTCGANGTDAATVMGMGGEVHVVHRQRVRS